MRTSMLSIILSLLVAAASAGCGRKAAPEAPESYAPSPAQFLQARGRVEGVLLEWQAPDRDASGERLEGRVGYRVQRSLHIKGEAPDFETIGVVAPKTAAPQAEAPQAAGPGRQEQQPAAVRYSYLDRTVKPGVEYDYVVIPVGESGVEGLPGVIARVTFVGERSLIQTYPAPVSFEDAVTLEGSQGY